MSICIYMVRLSLVSELSYNNTYTPLFTRKISPNHSLHSLSFAGMSFIAVAGPGTVWSDGRTVAMLFAYVCLHRHHHAQVGGKIDCQLPTSWAEKTGWFHWRGCGRRITGETEEVVLTACCPHTSQPTTRVLSVGVWLAEQERPTESVRDWKHFKVFFVKHFLTRHSQ